MKKNWNKPMEKLPMHLSPRCLARTRRGTLCQCPAMPNGRCKLHGGKSTGAPTGNALGGELEKQGLAKSFHTKTVWTEKLRCE